jgi:hypothetical protein
MSKFKHFFNDKIYIVLKGKKSEEYVDKQIF